VLPVKILALLFGVIPLPVTYVLARILHPLFHGAVKRGKWGIKTRRIIPKVFSHLSRPEQDRIMRENSLHLLKFAGEMLKAHYGSDFCLRRRVYIAEGEERYRALCESGRGFTIITCHLGNWEWAAAYLALGLDRDYGGRELYAPVFVEDSGGNDAINWVRQGHRVVLLEAGRDPRVSARTLLRMVDLLKRGEIVYLVTDQAAMGGDYRGSLFGAELRIFGGPFILGKKTGLPFLPLYCLRDGNNRLALHFEEPFHLKGENVKEDIRRVTGFFERNIGAHPEQYLWSQDRW
jgi:lauroyl/myristoyl acyltransferase